MIPGFGCRGECFCLHRESSPEDWQAFSDWTDDIFLALRWTAAENQCRIPVAFDAA